MKKFTTSKVATAALGITTGGLLGFAVVYSHNFFAPQTASAAPADKVTICHATSSDVNPYNKITVSANAAYTQCDPDGNGHGGHFCEGGSTAHGHEDDLLLQGDVDCPSPATPTPSPSPTPSPDISPSPSVTPSPTPEVTPSPSPSVTPSPTPSASPTPSVTSSPTPNPEESPEPTATPTPTLVPSETPTPTPSARGGITPTVKKTSDLFTANATCDENTVHAWQIVKYDGKPQQNVKVTFKYKNQEKVAYTNNSGQASVYFTYESDGDVTSHPEEGYQGRSNTVTKETGCDVQTITHNGQVLGASTSPHTFAETGTALELLQNISLFSGSASVIIGTVLKKFEK